MRNFSAKFDILNLLTGRDREKCKGHYIRI